MDAAAKRQMYRKTKADADWAWAILFEGNAYGKRC
jgi:hypothetical protein